MKTGIIFDLDGTLWDACRGIADAWTEYLRLYEPDWYAKGVRVREQVVRDGCGKTMDIFTAMLLHDLPEEEQKRLYEPICAYEVVYLAERGASLYPGVQEIMEKLSEQYQLFVVSNCQEGYIQAFLSFSGTERYVTDTADYGSTGLDKDENIRLLLKRHHLDRAVYVGDTQGDYEKTTLAGLPFIFASYGFGSLDERVQVPRISSLSQLPDALNELWGEKKRRNIILIGMPGVGKSTIGVLAAKMLGYRFLDSDLVIQEEEGMLLSEIIAQRGIDGFLQAEEKVNCSLSCERTMIATGGSVVYKEKAMQHLKSLGEVIWLRLSYPALEKRLGDLKGRGVVLRDGQTLYDLYKERTALYEMYADRIIDEDGRGLEEAVEMLVQSLNRKDNGYPDITEPDGEI